MDDKPAALGWWTISGEDLLDMMRRVAYGEDPDLVYAEEYANCEIEHPSSAETTATPAVLMTELREAAMSNHLIRCSPRGMTFSACDNKYCARWREMTEGEEG